jgi:hypothetical protein
MRAGGQSGVEQGLSKRVAELFKASYKRAPWPDESQCYPLAVVITVIRNGKSYRTNFERESELRRGRRAVVQATKRLIKDQRKILSVQLASLQLPGWMEDAKNLELLEAALEQATPALLRPFDPQAGRRSGAWWHKAARMIAWEVEAILREVERKELERKQISRKNHRKKISFQKHGAAVNVVVGALKLAIGKELEPATVADVLKLPSKSGEVSLLD